MFLPKKITKRGASEQLLDRASKESTRIKRALFQTPLSMKIMMGIPQPPLPRSAKKSYCYPQNSTATQHRDAPNTLSVFGAGCLSGLLATWSMHQIIFLEAEDYVPHHSGLPGILLPCRNTQRSWWSETTIELCQRIFSS